MAKRKWLIVGGLVLLVVVAVVSVRMLWTTPIEPGPTPENFRRLCVGMEKKEVERILGRPKIVTTFRSWWEKDDCRIMIHFEPNRDLVAVARYGELEFDKRKGLTIRPPPKSFLEKIRDSLGL